MFGRSGVTLLLALLPATLVAADARIDLGRRLLAQYQCGACHRIPGVEHAAGTLGPNLAAFRGRSYIAGAVPNTRPLLLRWLVDPKSLVPDTTMPAMGVTVADAQAIAAYLATLE